MVIAPCSIRTMAEIATGTTSSALTRAADVVLKEQRKLILMLRETPLHAGHLENLGFGQPIRTRDTRPSVGSMVASGTRVPQRDWRAEPNPLCLFQPKPSISSRAEWTRNRLRYARSPDQRRRSAAGARRFAYPYQSAWDS